MKKRKVSQSSIARMLKAGKPLAGLLVGLSSTLATAAEREESAPTVMGKPASIASATNKVSEACGSEILGALSNPASVTNKVFEKCEVFVTMGEIPSSESVMVYRVVEGDTLTKIAKRFATTVEALKRLNGFDDARANALKAGEVIRILPEPKPNQCPPQEPVQEKEKPTVPDNSDNETDGLIIDGDVIMGDFG